jgi:hypothetical protein
MIPLAATLTLTSNLVGNSFCLSTSARRGVNESNLIFMLANVVLIRNPVKLIDNNLA